MPVLMQTPPTTDRDSTIATFFFSLEAATAARCPDGPEPTTTRSYLTALILSTPGEGRDWNSKDSPHPEANTARPLRRCRLDEDFRQILSWNEVEEPSPRLRGHPCHPYNLNGVTSHGRSANAALFRAAKRPCPSNCDEVHFLGQRTTPLSSRFGQIGRLSKGACDDRPRGEGCELTRGSARRRLISCTFQ